MELLTQESEVAILPVPSPAVVTSTKHAGLLKVSVSEANIVIQDLNAERSDSVDIVESTCQLEAAPLYADTFDVEELLDSSGVEAFPPVTSIMTWDSAAFPEFEGEFRDESGHSDTEQDQYRAKVASTDRQLTVKVRSVIRKYFTAAMPVQLPAGHTAVAFNEDQVHTVLRTIADESVISSYRMMNSLLLHPTHGASQDKMKSLPRRCATPARQPYDSLGDESSLGNTPLMAIQAERTTQMRILTSWVPSRGLMGRSKLVQQGEFLRSPWT